MASEGYGVKVSDILGVAVVAGIVIIGYKLSNSKAFEGVGLASEGLGGAISGIGGGVGQIGETTGDFFSNTVGEVGETFKAVSDKIQSGISKIGTSDNRNLLLTTSTPVTSANPVSSITSNLSQAYGMPTVTVKTASGASSTIVAAKGTYYPSLGVGFDTSGQGYSSAFANKSNTTNTVQTSSSKLAAFKSAAAGYAL